MTTSNKYNAGIAHLSKRIGGDPFCGNKRAMICVTPSEMEGEQVCQRCKNIYERKQARKIKLYFPITRHRCPAGCNSKQWRNINEGLQNG